MDKTSLVSLCIKVINGTRLIIIEDIHIIKENIYIIKMSILRAFEPSNLGH